MLLPTVISTRHHRHILIHSVQLILRHSSYAHVNRDRLFFEGLYISLINICDDAFRDLDCRSAIEVALGDIFRGRRFNLYRRINAPPRPVDTLSVKELYAIKHETSNRALNAKLLSALRAKPPAINIQAASAGNSPMIANFITSPITARAIAKDPEQKSAPPVHRD
jgi:hypothetical protein